MDEQLLNFESSEDSYSDALFKKLLLSTGPNVTPDDSTSQAKSSGGVPFIVIKPKPGFCMKTRTEKGDKVFVNICHSENVPEPKDLTNDELLKVLESEDPTQFRIPMSIGEPHAELDKTGGGCTAYDVIVHSNFIKKIENNELFKTFFLTIMCEGLEEKYNILLKRDWIFLKNRKSVGSLADQNVRTTSKPLIMDLDSPAGDQLPEEQPEKRNLITEVQQHEESLMKKAPEPKFSIVQEPHEGYPDFLVAEIHLPNIKIAQSLTLDIGEDRLLLATRSHVYHLDIFLPFNLINEECGAQFDRISKVLTVTMPVKPFS